MTLNDMVGDAGRRRMTFWPTCWLTDDVGLRFG